MKYTVNDGFPYYIEFVADKNYRSLFTNKENINWLKTITEEQSTYAYAPGKWSIKQIVGHITDHERIMTYRALRFSRNDKTLLPGYDQNLFVENSSFNKQPYNQLINDLENVRNASISFMQLLTAQQLQLTGTAWKYELTVEEFLKATIGHEAHHITVLKEKYFVK